MKRIAIALVGIASAMVLGGLPSSAQNPTDAKAQPMKDGAAAPGQRVYVAYCATCHGLKGNGRGPEAVGFAQHPTDFTKGTYKLRSTTEDIPAPGDLERTIREGMSGTEMVPFKRILSERSIEAVAAYIRGFSEELADPEAVPDADSIVKIPQQRPFPRSAETIAAGKALWGEHDCADCHGDTGEGSTDATDDWDFPVVMVSFHAGYYKSGPTDQDLFRSIATGMKGTEMDGYLGDASEEDIWKMVDYIRSLSGEGQQALITRVLDFLVRRKPSGFNYSNY